MMSLKEEVERKYMDIINEESRWSREGEAHEKSCWCSSWYFVVQCLSLMVFCHHKNLSRLSSTIEYCSTIWKCGIDLQLPRILNFIKIDGEYPSRNALSKIKINYYVYNKQLEFTKTLHCTSYHVTPLRYYALQVRFICLDLNSSVIA